jgi:uncharacterized membrane protein YedE/YeeE
MANHYWIMMNWMISRLAVLTLSALVTTTLNAAQAMSNQQLNKAASEFASGKVPELCMGKGKLDTEDNQKLENVLISNGLKENNNFTNQMGEYFVYALMFGLADGMAQNCPEVDRVTVIQNFMESFNNKP